MDLLIINFSEMDNKKFTPQQILNESYNGKGGLNITDIMTDIALGNVAGQSIMSAMGERITVGDTANGEDVWRGVATTIPVPSPLGEQMSIASSDAQDTDGGTGVRTIIIHYLDSAGVENEEVITMNGTTEVDTVATDIIFINDFHTVTVGSNGVAEGDIDIYQKGDNTRVYNILEQGGNKSLVPNRMVPAGKTLVLKGWHCSEARDKRTIFRNRSTDHYGVIIPGVFLFKDTAYLRKNATGELSLNVSCPALSIVKVSAWGEQEDGEGSCGWWGVLTDNV